MNIEINNVNKDINGNIVLRNINLKLASGRIYGFKGINGSGKTMLMRCLCGLIYPTEGEVIIDGNVLGDDIKMPPSVGVLIEGPAFLPEYTGFENLRFLADLQGGISDNDIKSILSDVGLKPNDKRNYRKYSLGMKQRLGIAGALLGEPKLVILDEPMNSIDENGKMQIRNLILREKQRGALVVLADHDSAELDICSDEVIELASGAILNIYIPSSGNHQMYQKLSSNNDNVRIENKTKNKGIMNFFEN